MMTSLVIPTDAPVVYGPLQGQWTVADWEALPDDGNRYEIIDGVLYMSTAPSFFHQWIIFRFHELIGFPARQQGFGYGIGAPIGLFMPGCDPVQPDYVFVRKENADIIRERRIIGVPDLIVEVMSPGSVNYDDDVKKKAYAGAGVPEYALVDPRARLLKLYSLDESDTYPEPRIFNEGESMTFVCLPSIALRIGDLFADSPDTTL